MAHVLMFANNASKNRTFNDAYNTRCYTSTEQSKTTKMNCQ